MSTLEELLATQVAGKKFVEKANLLKYPEKVVEKIRKRVGADSLIYLSVPELISAIGKQDNELCTACISARYPTPYGKKLLKKGLHNGENIGKMCKRLYE